MGSSPSSVYIPPNLPVLPVDQRLDEQGSNYLEWRARMRAILEAYDLWDKGDQTPKVFGTASGRGAAFAKAILLVNMQDSSMASRPVLGMDIFTERRFIKLDVEDENVATIWRRLQGTNKPRDLEDLDEYENYATW